MAEHYGTAVVPARPWKPRDKAKVEVAVQIAERWIAARLRNQQFFSLSELNASIRILLDALSLDLAIDALESLQSQGRQVGVISHVEAMKDRIPTRIAVRKQGGGMSIVEVTSPGPVLHASM